jgi:hypothetical protein
MSRKQAPMQSYLKYSGMAFQMVILIALAYYLGNLLDKKLENNLPAIGIFTSIGVFVLYIYKLYVELFNKKK